MKKRHHLDGFTLIEIMIVVAIIALLAAVALPNFMRARKRSQSTRMLEDLRVIEWAIDQYAIEQNKSAGVEAVWADLQPFLKKESILYNSGGKDPLGGDYIGFTVDEIPKLSAVSFAKLSDVAPSDFWSPFYP